MAVTKKKVPRRTVIVLLLILIPVGIYLAFQIYLLYVLGYLFTPYPATDQQKELYKNYEAFAKKVMPHDFKLISTYRNPGTIDNATVIDQKYSISGTRKDILNELTQRFSSYGYYVRIDYLGTDIQGDQTFLRNSTKQQAIPLDMNVTFYPPDPDCGPPGMDGCPSIPTVVKEVEISWQ